MELTERKAGDWLVPGDEDDGPAGMVDADGGGESGQEVEVRRLTVEAAGHGLRLDRLLADRLEAFSRSHLQGLIEQGHVRVDGAVVQQASKKLKAGQSIEVGLVLPEACRAFRPEPLELVVVHEDEHLCVVDKPAGLVVHPAPGNWSGTLLNGLLHRDPGAQHLPRAGIVHRLDKDTSGLMVVARSLQAMQGLVQALAARRVHRRYLALAQGRVVPAAFTVEAPVGRDPAHRTRMGVVAGGKPARTDVHVLGGDARFSAVTCKLHTGRTHQIRVHLASRGHPLVADALYGGAPALGLTRQALHATELAFDHPVTGRRLALRADLPPDLAQAWRQIASAPDLSGLPGLD